MSDKIIDFSEVEKMNSIKSSDLLHVARKNSSGTVLSYKSELERLGDVLVSKSKIDEFLSEIAALNSSLNALTSTFITKSEIDTTYCDRTTFDNRTEKLLTISDMESILEKYPDQADLDEKYASAREYTFKLAEEFTDFIAAAQIGIAQGLQQNMDPGE